MTNNTAAAGPARTALSCSIVTLVAAIGGALASPAAWTELTPEGELPPERNAAAGAYDPTANRMVLFGGRLSDGSFAGDLWVLTAANGLGGPGAWIQLLPGGETVPATAEHSAVYDTVSNHLIVFGGQSASGLSNDVYRGLLSDLVDEDGDGLSDPGYGTCANSVDAWTWDNLFTDEQVPSGGTAFFYLVSPVDAQGPGGLGTTSSGLFREPFVPCPR